MRRQTSGIRSGAGAAQIERATGGMTRGVALVGPRPF